MEINFQNQNFEKDCDDIAGNVSLEEINYQSPV